MQTPTPRALLQGHPQKVPTQLIETATSFRRRLEDKVFGHGHGIHAGDPQPNILNRHQWASKKAPTVLNGASQGSPKRLLSMLSFNPEL